MPPPHLALDVTRHVLRAEGTRFLRQHDLKRDVEQYVAHLAEERGPVARADRVVQLHHLFDEVRPEGGGRLRGIPRAAGPQVSHEFDDASKR